MNKQTCPQFELLLEACLVPRARVAETFRLDDVEPASVGLLPLLYRNLAAARVEHASMGKLKGMYRRCWYANQRLLKGTAGVLDRLHEIGIPTVMIHDVPLAIRYYRDLGARPLHKASVVVPPERAEEALRAVEELGFLRTTWMPRGKRGDFFRFRHAAGFRDPEGNEVQLHWRALWLARHDFGDYTEPLEVGGCATKSLKPTEELLLTCARGFTWEAAPLWWAADATMLLRNAAIDWERLLRTARETRTVLPLREALGYVAERFAAGVPVEVLRELEASQAPGEDRRLHLWMSNPGGHRSVLKLVPACWAMQRRTIGRGSWARSLVKLPRFVEYHWRVDRKRDLPGRAWRWLRRSGSAGGRW
ncbi:MAG: nucleotidyltransferase family protein [Bryobacteraceae bacterium]|nr:nucleotidyltransferase family protein [Bryobacteraceae bacterium]